jgi:AmmeMemoRadiSam system protein A
MSPLCNEERRALLDLARRAIVEAVCQGRLLGIPTPADVLAKPSGAFVTLHRRGQLCGCIGQVEVSQESLAATVVRCAVGAACEDPRFRPVRPEEVAELEIEISVLSPLEPLRPEAVEVGRHGLMVIHYQQRGVLLPQVAVEHRWTRERFLEETCIKAGLERDAWRGPGALLLGFTAEVFSEADLQAQRQVRAG